MSFDIQRWTRTTVRQRMLVSNAIPGKVELDREAAGVEELLTQARSLVAEENNSDKLVLKTYESTIDYDSEFASPFWPDHSVPFIVYSIRFSGGAQGIIHVHGFFVLGDPKLVKRFLRRQLDLMCPSGADERSRYEVGDLVDRTCSDLYQIVLGHPQETESLMAAMGQHDIDLMENQACNALIVSARERARADFVAMTDPSPVSHRSIRAIRPDTAVLNFSCAQDMECFSVICDSVGMGKTLSAISVIKYNGPRSLGPHVPTMVQRPQITNTTESEDRIRRLYPLFQACVFDLPFQYHPTYNHENGVCLDANAAGTLVLCPLSLVSQWYVELCRVFPAESILIYHGPRRKRITAARMARYDVVLMPTSLLPTLMSDYTMTSARFETYLVERDWQSWVTRSTVAPWVYGRIEWNEKFEREPVHVFAQLSPHRWSVECIRANGVVIRRQDVLENNVVLVRVSSRAVNSNDFKSKYLEPYVHFGRRVPFVRLCIQGVVVKALRREDEAMRSVSLPFRLTNSVHPRAVAADLYERYHALHTHAAPRFLYWTRIIVDECHLIPKERWSRTASALYSLARSSTIGISASVDKLREGSILSLTKRAPVDSELCLLRHLALVAQTSSTGLGTGPSEALMPVQFHRTAVQQINLMTAQQRLLDHIRSLIRQYTRRALGFAVIQAIRMLRTLTAHATLGYNQEPLNIAHMMDRLTAIFMQSPFSQHSTRATESSRGVALVSLTQLTESIALHEVPGGATCPICLTAEEDQDLEQHGTSESNERIDWIALLPCKHVICKDCAVEMGHVESCAMCRARVLRAGNVVRQAQRNEAGTPIEVEAEEPNEEIHGAMDEVNFLLFSYEKLTALTNLVHQNQEHSEKTLVFIDSNHVQGTFLARYLREHGVAAKHLSGSHTASQRARILHDFIHGDASALILRYRTGSVGLNLQRANHLVLFDLPSRKDYMDQAIGRINRVGQTRMVHVYPMYCPSTFEERVWHRWLQGVHDTTLQQELYSLLA